MIVCPKCKQGVDIDDANVRQTGFTVEDISFEHIICPSKGKDNDYSNRS